MGRNRLPAQALDGSAARTTTMRTARLVRATVFDDIHEASETTLIVDEEALRLTEDRFVIDGGKWSAVPRLRPVDLGQDVGEIRRWIHAVGPLLVEVTQNGQKRVGAVDV